MELFDDGPGCFEGVNMLHFCKEKAIEVVADSRNGKDAFTFLKGPSLIDLCCINVHDCGVLRLNTRGCAILNFLV